MAICFQSLIKCIIALHAIEPRVKWERGWVSVSHFTHLLTYSNFIAAVYIWFKQYFIHNILAYYSTHIHTILLEFGAENWGYLLLFPFRYTEQRWKRYNTIFYYCDKLLDKKHLPKLDIVFQTSSKRFGETPSICLFRCLGYIPFCV